MIFTEVNSYVPSPNTLYVGKLLVNYKLTSDQVSF